MDLQLGNGTFGKRRTSVWVMWLPLMAVEVAVFRSLFNIVGVAYSVIIFVVIITVIIISAKVRYLVAMVCWLVS